MHAQRTGIARRIVPLVILITFTFGASLYPQFLEDEEEKVPDDIARSITAEPSSLKPDGTCSIKISWQLNPNFTGGDYIVAKSGGVIDTTDKVRAARVIATVRGEERNAIEDKECAPGSYYYVVLSKKGIVENRMGLIADGNFTTSPAVIGEPEQAEELVIAGIMAQEMGDLKVRLTWLRPDKTGVYYYVYRAEKPIDSETALKKADKLGIVTDADTYIDESIKKPGNYFYAVTARVLKGKENKTLVADSNFTTRAVVLGRKAPEPVTVEPERVAVTSIDASRGGDAVMVRWTYTGRGEGVKYRLFRSWRALKSAGEVKEGHVLTELDLSVREYRDQISLPGKYYYGLIPTGVIVAGNAEKGDFELVPGVSITRTPILIKEEPKITKIDIGETEDIDRIIKRTFFRGRYRSAIKELFKFVKSTDNERVTAKARLFVGRSYIELGEYRKALDYLFSPVVKRHFPKQAAFWQEFALTRLRNY